MRYAILSDIHGNLEALDAVLAALAGARVVRYLCAGDLVGYGTDPAHCLAKIRALEPGLIAPPRSARFAPRGCPPSSPTAWRWAGNAP